MLANVRIEAGTMVVVDRALGIEGLYRMTRQRCSVGKWRTHEMVTILEVEQQ